MSLVPLSDAALEREDATSQVLVWCERGRDAMNRACSLVAGQDVLGMASTLEHAVRVRDLNSEAVVAASSLRVRAERRVGELIQEEREAGRLAVVGQRQPGGDQKSPRPTGDPVSTLADHGISRDQASEFTRLADVPEEVFEEALADVSTSAGERRVGVTRAGVLRAINPEREKSPEARWLEADRFFERCGRLPQDVEGVLGAIRYGIYPGDQPLVRSAPRLLLNRAISALMTLDKELRRKGL